MKVDNDVDDATTTTTILGCVVFSCSLILCFVHHGTIYSPKMIFIGAHRFRNCAVNSK